MSKVYLKVKIKSLSEEARIIRFEQRKAKLIKDHVYRSSLYFGLYDHRTRVVRAALRNSYLAYAFVRGKKRVVVEHKCFVEPDYGDIARLSYKYGANTLKLYNKKEFAIKLYEWLFADDPYSLAPNISKANAEQKITESLKKW